MVGRALARALEYQASDLAVFPIPRGEKAPNGFRWRRFQENAPSEQELRLMFDGQEQNIAIMCGRASGNLVGLDDDTPAAFTESGVRLSYLGIETATIRRLPNGSPHDGGGTRLFRTPVPVARSKCGDTDILGQGSYTMAPPSLHPGGGEYFFANGTAQTIYELPSLDVLDWLKLEAYQERIGPKIPRKARRLLQGDQRLIARYHSRSEAEAAVCASLVRAGFDFSFVISLFQVYPGPGKFQELLAQSPERARRYLHRTWHQAIAWTTRNDSKASRLAHQLRQWALTRAWPGQGGPNDRLIYLAHLDIVARSGAEPHGASARELSEMAGISWQTAAKVNGRLQDAGLLELAIPSTPSLSNRWRLLEPAELGASVSNLDTQSIPTVMECRFLEHNHDAFRWKGGGLCKSGAEVLGALLQAAGPLSVREIVERTGRGRTTVWRKLRQLYDLALAEPDPLAGRYCWVAVPDPDLDRAAEEIGTAGKAEHQRRQHFLDRRYRRLQFNRNRNMS